MGRAGPGIVAGPRHRPSRSIASQAGKGSSRHPEPPKRSPWIRRIAAACCSPPCSSCSPPCCVPAAGAAQPAAPADCPGLAGTLQRIAGECPAPTSLGPQPAAHGLGTISGTVTETGTGAKLEAITAFFTDAATLDSAGEAETGPDGTYSIELPPGDYHILFAEETGAHVALMWEDTLSYADSSPVTVVADQTTTVDKAMGTDGGTISGVVTDFDGNPVEGGFVLAVAEHPNWSLTNIAKASLGVAETAADGSYTIGGLPTGDYWVIFVSITSFAWYGSDTYTDDPVADGATLVPVTAPANTGSIDGSVEYGNGGLLLGTLEDGFGPVEGICVEAVPTANLTITVASAVTDADGNYTLAGLAGTAFYLRYQDCTRDIYVTTWYPAITTDQPTGADVFTLSETDLQFIFDTIDLRLTDVDTSVFRPDIIWLAGEGITKGCNTAQTLFCPNLSVTRGQMAAFLVRALPLTEVDPATTFTDDDTSVFETDIAKLATAGITKGCGTNLFCPNAPVTRGQMAAFLVRALDLTEVDPAITFTDDDTSVFETDIAKLATAGITKGCGTNLFCPDAPVTRGQMAAFLKRALQ